MRILVTGGGGFIGSHLCDRLVLDGHKVIALDNFSTGKLTNLDDLISNPGFTVVEGSVLNSELLRDLMESVDYVFHLQPQLESLTLSTIHLRVS